MLHYTHGLFQAHNHRPCSSTSKPQVPKPTASRVTPQMSPHTLSPPLQGWGTTQASPAGIALIYTQQDAALCPVPPAHAARLECHSKVTWQEPPAGLGKGSLSLPCPPVPSPSHGHVQSGAAAGRGLNPSSSPAQHSTEAPETDIAQSFELQSYALASKTRWLWFGGQRG